MFGDTLQNELSPLLNAVLTLPRNLVIFLAYRFVNTGTQLSPSQLKGDFWDAVSLHCGITPTNLSSTCQCGTPFSVDRAMVCLFGGFSMIRCNDVLDLTASLLTEVCHNVAAEPSLQPITSATFSFISANITNDACLDIRLLVYETGCTF